MTVLLTRDAWTAWQTGLYERDERLGEREAGAAYARDEVVDDYVLSAHAEALLHHDLDGGLWEAVEDLDLEDVPAGDDDAAWAAVKGFYLERGGELVLVDGADGDGADEWVFTRALLERLHLPGLA